MLTSSAAQVPDNAPLLSPPRNWPNAFKENMTLSNFVNKTIKAQKARLTSTSPDDIAAEARAVALVAVGTAANAARVHATLGWPVLKGFAIYELADTPNVFVARQHVWNVHPRNIWVDLTPRSASLASVLLVEADVDAAFARAGVQRDAPMDIRDAPPPDAPPSDAQVAAAEAQVAATEPMAPAAEPAAVAALSYDEILASMSLGPKATLNASGLKMKKKVRLT